MRLSIRNAGICAAALTASLLPQAAFADGHLPVLTISPISTFTSAGNATGTPINPPIEGQVDISGTATIPIYKGLSISYDRITGGLFYTTFNGVSIPGLTDNFQAGSVHDVINQYRVDEVVNKYLTVEGGFAHRYRQCCGAGTSRSNAPTSALGHASTEFHQVYLALTGTTPNFGKKFHYSELIVNVTARAANHNPSPAAIAGYAPGQSLGNVREYGVTEAVTLVLPIDLKNHLTGTATYLNGTPETWEDQPFPYRYNIEAFGLIKEINPYIGFQAGWQNVWQQRQGSPFPLPGVIHVSEFSTQLDFHLDFNKIFGQPKPAVPGSV